MERSCVIFILGVIVLVSGEETTTDVSTEVPAAVNSTEPPAEPVVFLVLTKPNNESLGNSSGVLLIALEQPSDNGTLRSSNSSTEQGPEKTMPEGPPMPSLSEAKLIRRKRTFSKHKGCMICPFISKHMQNYQPASPSCNSCRYSAPPPPCGGCGGGHPMGGWSMSSSQSSSSAFGGSWGKK